MQALPYDRARFPVAYSVAQARFERSAWQKLDGAAHLSLL